MAREKVNARKTAISLRTNLDGWVEFRGKSHGGMSGYLNSLAEADRDSAPADVMEKYRAYLVATDRDQELQSLDQ